VWSGAQAGALGKLFGSEAGPLLRAASRTFFLVTLARGVLDAQFSNYALYRFGWGPQESGPLLVPAAPPCPPHHPARRTTLPRLLPAPLPPCPLAPCRSEGPELRPTPPAPTPP